MFWYMFPLLFNMVASGSLLSLAAGDDGEELKKDAAFALLGPITSVPLFGEIMRGLTGMFLGEPYWAGNDIFSRYGKNLSKLVKHWQKEELEVIDFVRAVSIFAETSAGVPFETLYNETLGALEAASEGDLDRAALQALGNTPNRAKIITNKKD